MALTRRFLNSLKLDEAVVESIIEAHSETVDALKQQRDDALASSASVEELTRERDELKQQLEALRAKGGDAARVQADFDAYKKQVEDERSAARADADVLAMLKEAGIQRESFLQLASRAFDRSRIQYAEGGEIANRAELVEAMRTEYADCIATDPAPKGAPPADPPSGGGKKITREMLRTMTPEEINANWDAVQAALRG